MNLLWYLENKHQNKIKYFNWVAPHNLDSIETKFVPNVTVIGKRKSW